MRHKAFIRNVANTILVTLSVIYFLLLIKILYLDRATPAYFVDAYRHNLVPLRTINMYILHHAHFNWNTLVANLIGNIVVFIPLGCIYAYFIQGLKRFVPFVLSIIVTIVVVEGVQLLLRLGSFDIDDIILNSIGGIIGFYTLMILKFIGSHVERSLYLSES